MVAPCSLAILAVQDRPGAAQAQEPSECPPLTEHLFDLCTPLLIALL